MFQRKFWIMTIERVALTTSSYVLAELGVAPGLSEVDWGSVIDKGSLIALITLLASLAATGRNDPSTPDILKVR